MFKNIFSLSTNRTASQAFGFYIAYLVMLMLGASIAGAIAAVITGIGFQAAMKIGQIIAIVSSLALGFSILSAKRSFSFGNVLIVLLSGILAVLGGGFLGLIPVSILTTKSVASTEDNS